MIHELKTDPKVFDAVKFGKKKFEIRKDDRAFEEGDVLKLRRTEYTGEQMKNGSPLVYTPNEKPIMVFVSHILRGPIYGLSKGWVIMSIEFPARQF